MNGAWQTQQLSNKATIAVLSLYLRLMRETYLDSSVMSQLALCGVYSDKVSSYKLGSPTGGRGRNDFPSWPPGTTVLVLSTSPGRFKPLPCLFRED